MFALARNVSLLDREMHSDRFEPKRGIELRGRTLGIAGFGNIGRQVALIASRGVGMKVSAYDVLSLGEQCGKEGDSEEEFLRRYGIEAYYTEYDEFAKAAGILSVHMPVTGNTRGFFDKKRLALLPNDAYIINTSRGALIDEAALYDALEAGTIRGAALDVMESEPYVPVIEDRDLRRLNNVVLTPHVASNTLESNRNIASSVVSSIDTFVDGRFDELPRIV
jgi:phosphoglycerate dehydrogenase-like enzyme